MQLGFGLAFSGGATKSTIGITTAASLDPNLMQVGMVLQNALVSGTYPNFQGNVVSEAVTEWTVNSVALTGPDATSYTLITGDEVGQAQITASATGAPDRVYYSEITGVTDYSFTPTGISWTVPAGAAVPDAFTAGQWSVADDGTNGDATITISTLPADNGSALTDLEYRLNGGAAVSLAGTATGNYAIAGLTDGASTNVEIRAVNGNGSGAWSDTKAVTTTGVPSAFVVGNWTLTDLTTGGDARIAISALPSANGSALTDLEYKKDAGAWTTLGGTTTGNYDLNNIFTDGVSANVLIRAVNANGNGADSDTKSVTTTTASGGIQLVGKTTDNTGGIVAKTISLTSLTGGLASQPAADDLVVVTYAGGSNTDRSLSATGYTTICQQRPNDTNDANHYVGYKVMGGTPDTQIDLTVGSASSTHGAVVIVEVWRGVDTTTPMDVTPALAQGTNSVLADPPSITPVTSGALVCASAAGAHDAGAVDYSSGDLGSVTAVSADGVIDVSALHGSVAWTSGAVDPAALTFGASDTNAYSWSAVSYALRPA